MFVDGLLVQGFLDQIVATDPVPHRVSWNFDATTAEETARSYLSTMVGVQGYSSDHYKEWELRKEMW